MSEPITVTTTNGTDSQDIAWAIGDILGIEIKGGHLLVRDALHSRHWALTDNAGEHIRYINEFESGFVDSALRAAIKATTPEALQARQARRSVVP